MAVAIPRMPDNGIKDKVFAVVQVCSDFILTSFPGDGLNICSFNGSSSATVWAFQAFREP